MITIGTSSWGTTAICRECPPQHLWYIHVKTSAWRRRDGRLLRGLLLAIITIKLLMRHLSYIKIGMCTCPLISCSHLKYFTKNVMVDSCVYSHSNVRFPNSQFQRRYFCICKCFLSHRIYMQHRYVYVSVISWSLKVFHEYCNARMHCVCSHTNVRFPELAVPTKTSFVFARVFRHI